MIRVKVIPNAGRVEITVEADCVKVKLTSQPAEGKANKELLKLLGKKLQVAPSSMRIVRGLTSREKTVFINGANEADIRRTLTSE